MQNSLLDKLRRAAQDAKALASEVVVEKLPEKAVFRLIFSCETKTGGRQQHGFFPLEQAASLLETKNVANLAIQVVGADIGRTLFEITVWEKEVDSRNEPLILTRGPAAPPAKGNRFSINWHRSFYSIQEFEKSLSITQQLKSVSLLGNEFDDHSLRILSKFENLQYLKLYGTAVIGHGFQCVKNLCELKNVEWVSDGAAVTINELCHLGSVEDLLIGASDGVISGSRCFGNMEHLRSLYVFQISFDEELIFPPSIVQLSIEECRRCVLSGNAQARTPSLEGLSLIWSDLSQDDIGELLRRSPALQSVRICSEKIDDDLVAVFSLLQYLTSLQLTGKGVSNESCKYLNELKQLRLLGVRGTSIDAMNLDELIKGLPNLESLDSDHHLEVSGKEGYKL